MFNAILFTVLFFGWIFTYMTQQRMINKLQDRLIKSQDKFIYERIRIYRDTKEN